MKRLTAVALTLAAGGTLALLAFDAEPAMAYGGGSCPTAIEDCGTWTSPDLVCVDGVCWYPEVPLLGRPSPT